MANVDLSFCNHFTSLDVRHLMLFHEAILLFGDTEEHAALDAPHKGFAFSSMHSASGSVWNVEHWGQMDCAVFPFALMWLGFVPLTCLCLWYQFLSQEMFWTPGIGWFSLQVVAGPGCLVGIESISWLWSDQWSEAWYNSPLLVASGHFVQAEHAILQIPPMLMLNSATTAALGTWNCLFFLFDHLEQVSWGSLPLTADTMTTGLFIKNLRTLCVGFGPQMTTAHWLCVLIQLVWVLLIWAFTLSCLMPWTLILW